jgi:hypothetical protein
VIDLATTAVEMADSQKNKDSQEYVCDCSDPHKSKEWQRYAAAIAATYAKLPVAEADARVTSVPNPRKLA